MNLFRFVMNKLGSNPQGDIHELARQTKYLFTVMSDARGLLTKQRIEGLFQTAVGHPLCKRTS